ncbi:MAG: hypothetical protein HY044_00780 [Candidatus Woesebacteria bacterium]|nr:MAG: hypothetical protein HY044_00780 [Candidatus Woesebacteria bacterium]
MYSNSKGFSKILILLCITAFLLGSLMIYKNNIQKSPNPTPTPLFTPIKKRSVSPNVIKSITLGKSINPQTGNIIEKSSTFTIKDPSIYSVLELKSFTPPINISYILYRNGQYADFGGTKIEKPTDYLNFNMTLNQNGNRLPGSYRQNFYINGILEKAIVFDITQ